MSIILKTFDGEILGSLDGNDIAEQVILGGEAIKTVKVVTPNNVSVIVWEQYLEPEKYSIWLSDALSDIMVSGSSHENTQEMYYAGDELTFDINCTVETVHGSYIHIKLMVDDECVDSYEQSLSYGSGHIETTLTKPYNKNGEVSIRTYFS